MKVEPTALSEVLLIEPDRFGDTRGYFQETWHRRRYASSGIDADFVQDNLSFSGRGVLRGLHLQNPHPQGKLISVPQGEIFDAAVDVRVGSPHFGQWVGVRLSGEHGRQLWIPEGFAHGFCVLSETAIVTYKCTEFYTPESELTVIWNDPEIGIEWPFSNPKVSERDAAAGPLRALDRARLPVYSGAP